MDEWLSRFQSRDNNTPLELFCSDAAAWPSEIAELLVSMRGIEPVSRISPGPACSGFSVVSFSDWSGNQFLKLADTGMRIKFHLPLFVEAASDDAQGVSAEDCPVVIYHPVLN